MARDRWTYRVGGLDFGPVDYDSLSELAQSGQLTADDEISHDGESWKRAGDVVGLIPANKVEQRYSFAVPESIESDRRNGGAERDLELPPIAQEIPLPKSKPKPKKAPAKSAAAKPKPTTPADARRDMNSLLDFAEKVSADDLAKSVLSGAGGAISPQRGVRAKTPRKPEKSPNEKTPVKVPPPDSRADEKTSRDEPQRPTSTDKPSGGGSGAFVSDPPPASPKPPSESNSFSAPASPSRPAYVPPSKPKHKAKSSSSIDPAILVKVGGGLAAVLLVGAAVYFLPGMIGTGGAGMESIEETEALVKQVVGMSKSTVAVPDGYYRKVSRRAISVQNKIENAGGSLSKDLLKFHRTQLAPVFDTEDGLSEENVAKVEAAWKELRKKAGY